MALPALIPLLLKALTFAPAVFDAGKEIVSAVTGEDIPPTTTPEQLAERIEALPPAERATVMQHVLTVKAQVQGFDTERFKLLTEGDAEKVKATARPEIAMQAMTVVTIFARAVTALMYATIVEWLIRAGFELAGETYPVSVSVMSLIAEVAPAAEVIWAPLIASFWVSADVVKKYMGCRERDKAQEYEILAGRPLESAQATIEAAGNSLAGLVRAVKGR